MYGLLALAVLAGRTAAAAIDVSVQLALMVGTGAVHLTAALADCLGRERPLPPAPLNCAPLPPPPIPAGAARYGAQDVPTPATPASPTTPTAAASLYSKARRLRR